MALNSLMRQSPPRPSIPTRPNHQPLRGLCRRYIKHPRSLLFVFALGRHVPHAGQRYDGELQAFADLHGHDLDSDE